LRKSFTESLMFCKDMGYNHGTSVNIVFNVVSFNWCVWFYRYSWL